MRCRSSDNSFFRFSCHQSLTTFNALQNLGFLYDIFTFRLAMFVDNLMQLGFSQREAEVYLMLLRIGPSPASSLAQRVGMKRATVYSVLEALLERGLVTFEQDENYRKYIPHDPECLLFGLEKQNAELKFRMNLAKACIENLNHSVDDLSLASRKICFFRGCESIRESLIKRVDKKSTLFVLFLNFGTMAVDAECLQKFLENDCGDLEDLRLCVPLEKEDLAKRFFSKAKVRGVNLDSSIMNAELLVQGDCVYFLFSDKKDTQMMCVNDSTYAKFICEVLLSPKFLET
jgi:sugar-specific transcriptional regulator TrmB